MLKLAPNQIVGFTQAFHLPQSYIVIGWDVGKYKSYRNNLVSGDEPDYDFENYGLCSTLKEFGDDDARH